MKGIAEVLDEMRAEVAVLRDNKAAMPPDRLETRLREIENATIDLREWLSEDDAMLRSARTRAWLRGQFPQWMAQGLARFNPDKPKERQYLQLIVPLRANASAARDAGRRGLRRTG